MQYVITFIPESDYILVKLTGEIDVPTMKEVIEVADKVIAEKDCNNVLGDFREAGMPVNIMELIELYQYWIKSLKTHKLSTFKAKRVILISEDQKNADKYRFFETFSNNRSSRVRIFHNMEESIRWLKGD